MSSYVQTTYFGPKDALALNDPLKYAKGTEVDVELAAIAAAIDTKYDSGNLATLAQAQAESSSSVLMTPLRVANWSDANAGIVGDLQGLADPNADGILFWDDSAGAATFLTMAAGLAFSGTTLTLDPNNLTSVTPASGDKIVLADVSASGAAKVALISDINAVLDHDTLANVSSNKHIDHSTVSISAGTGLSGGGTIAANRTLSLDISGLTAMSINEVAATDGVLIDDGGTMKRMSFQSMGSRVQAASTQTLALDDGNSVFVNTGASNYTITVPPNSSVAFPIGTELAFNCQSTGTITLAQGSGVTITSLNSYKTVKASGGGAYLIKTDTNTWSLIGDLQS